MSAEIQSGTSAGSAMAAGSATQRVCASILGETGKHCASTHCASTLGETGKQPVEPEWHWAIALHEQICKHARPHARTRPCT
eukprot:8829282-Lingulodinium_polyedra.AAC.1